MYIFKEVGVIDFISFLIKPLFKKIMPNLKDKEAIEYLSMNIAANMFGLGFAATPSGLKGIKRLKLRIYFKRGVILISSPDVSALKHFIKSCIMQS